MEAVGTTRKTYTYSDAGFALTTSFEGLRLDAYKDVAGVPTIGYGHTGPDVVAGKRITFAEAEDLLRADLAASVACVNRALEVEVTQPQFDALVDFCFNTGRGAFLQSSLLRCVNRGDSAGAAAQFLLWVNAGGKRCAGLVRRRTEELGMFLGAAGKATA